jgi:4-hydroxybenzoate polyprenyltransferase
MNRWLRLTRAPAALTSLGDAVAGAGAARRPLRGRRLLLPLASAALYGAGMALNDWADRRRDATERPERPIPAGEIQPAQALIVAVGLTGVGLTLAAAGGGRAGLGAGLPVAAAVWAYDLLLASTPAAAAGMAACRALNVMLGAGTWRSGAGVLAAATMATHTVGVTVLSSGEVRGAAPRAAEAALVATAVAGTAALAGPARAPRHRAAAAVLGALYLATVGSRQAAVLRAPDAAAVRAATVAGVHGMIPLQAAVAARSGSWFGAAAVTAALPLARRLAKGATPA